MPRRSRTPPHGFWRCDAALTTDESVDSPLRGESIVTREVLPMQTRWKIGQVAQMTGMTIKAIRFYEAAGILPSPARSEAGFRLYGREDVRRLTFIKQARTLSLTLREAKYFTELLDAGCCSTVRPGTRALLEGKLQAVDARIRELTALRATLRSVVHDLAQKSDERSCEPGQCVPSVERPIQLVIPSAAGNSFIR